MLIHCLVATNGATRGIVASHILFISQRSSFNISPCFYVFSNEAQVACEVVLMRGFKIYTVVQSMTENEHKLHANTAELLPELGMELFRNDDTHISEVVSGYDFK